MSTALESLLDVARRRDCEINDAAFKELVMRHHTESPRTLARQMRPVDLPADFKEHHFMVVRPGKGSEPFSCYAGSTVEAKLQATEFGGDGAIVIPREECLEEAMEVEQ